jgi:hypothetical protein
MLENFHLEPRRWEDNIKTDLRGINYEGQRWMELADDHVHWY